MGVSQNLAGNLSVYCMVLQASTQRAALSGTARNLAVVGDEAGTGPDHINHTG